MQRDAHVSGLYWHTELESAKAAAAAQGRPILALRLRGNLNEEQSCANSRFFRTTLYANTGIAADLRSQYVLHWQSMSPAPRMTIDFGNGRTIERTITGNSVHYILNGHAVPLAVIPGLISPAEFADKLKKSAGLAKQLRVLSSEEQGRVLQSHHETAVKELERSFETLLHDFAGVSENGGEIMSMWTAGTLTEESLAPSTWARLANGIKPSLQFDTPSTWLIFSKAPATEEAGRIAQSKAIVETPAMKMMGNLTLFVSQDTLINKHLLAPRIHGWFTGGSSFVKEVSALNERVYTQRFRMPPSDPWLGLAQPDIFSALPANGLAGTVAP
jgi:hypothetical protein